MKKLVLATALVSAGLLGLQDTSYAHGGNYRGPGDTVPPGGGGGGGGGAGPAPGPSGPSTPGPSGPSTPGPLAPGAPTGSTATNPTTSGGNTAGADLTLWSFWWEFNKEPYLNLKSHIHSGAAESGSDGFFIGRGEKKQGKDSLRPTPQQIQDKVVPALKRALKNESDNDIVTGAMIALAKIGDANTEAGQSEFEGIIKAFLADSNQEIRETAAVSLGILANDNSIDLLNELLMDTPAGRAAVKSTEVDYRTRSFAAYGLGLIGARTGDDANRKRIVGILANSIANDDTKSRDLRVSCIVAMGLVKIDQMEAPAVEGEEGPNPAASRVDQLQYLMNYLQDEGNNYLVRAHCPTALARLLDGMPAELSAVWRPKIAEDLLERIGKRSKDKNEVIGSSVLALGLIGTSGADDLDVKIRETLAAVPKDVSDQQARNFSLIAMAKAGGTKSASGEKGIGEAGKFLLEQLSKGKSSIKPWAGLSIGVMGHRLKTNDMTHPTLVALSEALRDALETEKDKSKLGAFAIATGIMADLESRDILLDLLERTQDNEARGYVAVALGLMGERSAVEPIQKIIDKSKYRPELLKQAAISLGLLGDKDLVATLIEMLGSSKGLATQAAISSALGFIGDSRSIDPLVGMLENKDLTQRARGFAAVALGIVADKEKLPWNSKIAVDLNYRASTSTLVDSSSGTGILDIL